MKLKAKISIFLVLIIILFGILCFIIQTQFLLPSYQKIGEKENITLLNLCTTFVKGDIENISLLAKDWASWDDSYEFALGKNRDQFIKSALPDSILIDTKLDLIIYYNAEKKIIWSKISDSSSLKDTPVILLNTIFSNNNLLFDSENQIIDKKEGILDTPFGIMLFTSNPILHTDSTGPIAGTLVMAKILSKSLIEKINANLKTEFNIVALEKYELLPLSQREIEYLKKEKIKFVITPDGKQIVTYSLYEDISGIEKFLISIKNHRFTYLRAANTLKYSVYTLIVLGILLLVVLAWFTNSVIANPIASLTDHITKITSSKELTDKFTFPKERKDEIGTLAKEFDNLINEIYSRIETKKKIIDDKTTEMNETKSDSIFRLFIALNERGLEYGSHITKTKQMMIYFSKLVNIPDNNATLIGIASTLHDIGLIAFPNFKKTKNKSDSISEAHILKLHTTIGGNIFKFRNTKLSAYAEEIALYHHENWDGTGYMSGLHGEEIPLSARMMSIIDSFNSKLSLVRIINDDIYQDLIQYFQNYRSKIFDPQLVDIFINNIDSFIVIHNEYQNANWNLV